jgi:hypothetical protein
MACLAYIASVTEMLFSNTVLQCLLASSSDSQEGFSHRLSCWLVKKIRARKLCSSNSKALHATELDRSPKSYAAYDTLSIKEFQDIISVYLFLFLFFFFNGAAAHIGPWPPLMRFRNLTLIDNWQDSLDE